MWQLIKQFPLPNELRDGIIYCQRALRDFILQHQNLASKINILPKHQRAKVKKMMLDLEREIIEIGQEQEALVRTLSQRLKVFRAYVQQKTNINISEDVANGYVSRVLQVHNESVGQILPFNCTKRLTAFELSQKYCLENITKLEKFIDDDNANFAPWNPTPHDEQRSDGKIKKSEPKTYLRVSSVSKHCSSSSSSPSPVTPVPSRSLLKPKQERLQQEQQQSLDTSEEPEKEEGVSAARERRAFASVIESEDSRRRSSTGGEAKVASVDNESYNEEDASAGGTVKKEADAKQSTAQPQIYPRPGGIWMPGLRGRPPKGVKYIPASKLANIQANERALQQRKLRQMMGVRQRGRPPKVRVQVPDITPSPPTEPDPEPEHDSSEEQSTPVAFGRPSAAVRRGRSNLQLALNRLKRPPPGAEDAETFIQTTALEIAKKSKPSTGRSKLVKHGSSGSSGSSPSSRSSTPTLASVRLAASDDSSDRRCDAPLDSPPSGEPDAPPPNDIWELGMKALLNYFGLCTPEEAKAHRERRQERKRRSCYSTERKDFHYGRLDYYEQQQLQAATRTSKRPHQRPILYSPPVAVAKKRKHQQQQQQSQIRASGNVGLTGSITSRQRFPMRCMSLDSRDIFAAMSSRRCFVCNKTGSTLELSACTNCCNIYHISCHRSEAEDDTQLFRHRDNLCPVCLTAEDDGDKQG